MDNTDSLVECGLGFTCDMSKGAFVGKNAVAKEKENGVPSRRLLQILVEDPEPLMYHGEIVYRNGEIVGDVRAASYGFTLGGSVGLFMAHDPSGKKLLKNTCQRAPGRSISQASATPRASLFGPCTIPRMRQ